MTTTPTTRTTPVLAIVALVLAFLLPLIGLVLGIVAFVQSGRTGTGRGLAIAAIVVGAIMMILGYTVFLPMLTNGLGVASA